jgi:hypothetical protein
MDRASRVRGGDKTPVFRSAQNLRGGDTEQGSGKTHDLSPRGRGFLRFWPNLPTKRVQKSTSARRLHFWVHCIHFDQGSFE